jgi:hypothetical protein
MMGFQCPECNNKTLKIVDRIEMPPDARSDEITLQVIRCGVCNFEGIAVYEESRRGALESETIDHYGYTLDGQELKSIKALIKRCPEPANYRCACDSHQKLIERDGFGRWVKPGFTSKQKTFIIKL